MDVLYLDSLLSQAEDGNVGQRSRRERAEFAFHPNQASRNGGASGDHLFKFHPHVEVLHHDERQAEDEVSEKSHGGDVAADDVGQESVGQRGLGDLEGEVIAAIAGVEDHPGLLRVEEAGLTLPLAPMIVSPSP